MIYDPNRHTCAGLPLRYYYDLLHHSRTAVIDAWCMPGVPPLSIGIAGSCRPIDYWAGQVASLTYQASTS